MDRAFAHALGEAAGHALVRSRDRHKDMHSMTDRKPRVLLLEAEIRTSERTGRQWYSAWLGRARLIGFEADEPNDRGHRVIRFYAEEPEPRDAGSSGASRAPAREAASGRATDRPAAAGAPRASGDRYRAPRREGTRARQERVGGEIAAEHGVESDDAFNDPLPF